MNTPGGPIYETLHGQLFWVLLLLPISGAVWLAVRAKAKRNNTLKNRVFRRVFGFWFSLMIVWNLLLSSIHYTAIFYSGPFSIQVVEHESGKPLLNSEVFISWDVPPPPIDVGWWSLIVADVTSHTGWQKVDSNGVVYFNWQGWRFWQRGSDAPVIDIARDRATYKRFIAHPFQDLARGNRIIVRITENDIFQGNEVKNGSQYRIKNPP